MIDAALLMAIIVTATGAGGIVAACYHIWRGHACTTRRMLMAFGPQIVATLAFLVVVLGGH